MKALYRKYRPCKLSEVVGQEQVTKVLDNSLKQGKVSHAYLFIGPRGTGKTSVARIFAHEVNGFKYELEDDYVDIVEIDGASNRGIDNIRELREKAAIAPTSGKYKIYIIDEVHMLTKEAFNALLKTLEEPPAHVIFIMATTDAYKVPVTITSRAQTYTFKLADSNTMLDHLKSIAEKEGIKIDDDALKIIVKRGGGSFRDSLSLLDQISTLSDKEITKDLVISAMGLPEDEKIAELLTEYISGNIVKITTILKDLLNTGVKPETLAEEMITQIIAEPRPELLPLLAKLPEVKAPFPEAKLLVALAVNLQGKSSDNNLAFTSHSGARPAGPSTEVVRQSSPRENEQARSPIGSSDGLPRAAGATPRFANLRTPLRRDANANNSEYAQNTPNTIEDDSENAIINEAGSNRSSEDAPNKNQTNTQFDWGTFAEKVQAMNDAVYSQLMKTMHEFDGTTLHLYPERKIVKTILSRDNNKRILIDASGGVKINIHEYGEKPSNAEKDEILSKISDIMGGEVQNDGGGNPF